MKKVIHFVLIQFLVTVVFSQDYGTGDNTTDADLKKLLKAAARSRGDRIDLPDSFSIKQYAPQPQNQGKLETCVGWSTAYAARTISYMIKKNLTHPDSIKKYAFSPGYIYYKIKDPADKNCTIGSKIQDAMAVMKSTGAILKKDGLEDCMINFSKKLEQKKASPYLIKDYQLRNENIGSFSENDILDLKKSLTEKKPIVISLKIDNSFNKVSANSIWSPSSVGRGHAMCIVGYNDSIGNGGSFEVMNSYGTSWGNQGFFWLSYKQLISYGRYALELMDAEAPTTRGNGFKNLEIAGKIEFLKIRGRCADGEKIVISVTGPKINTNGIITGNNKASEFNLYRLNDTLQNDTKFQIRFSASTQSYIYIFSQDDKNIISEFERAFRDKFVNRTRNAVIGIFGFGLGLAFPFSLFAFFPSLLKSLPKSGGWLNTVKVTFGFIELALAMKFLSTADLIYHWRLLDRDIFLVIWIIIFALLGLYLLGKLKFSHDSDLPYISVPRLFFAIASFSFALTFSRVFGVRRSKASEVGCHIHLHKILTWIIYNTNWGI